MHSSTLPFGLDYSIDVDGFATDTDLLRFLEGRSEAEHEAWEHLVAWSRVRIAVRCSQIAANTGAGQFYLTIAPTSAARAPRATATVRTAETRVQPHMPRSKPQKGAPPLAK